MVTEIRPELFLIEVPLPQSPLKSLNSYVVRAKERNLVIDTGLNRPECHEALMAGLKALDIDPAHTDYFITHLHADHFGLVSSLKTPTSRVFFNRPDAEIIETHGGWEAMIQAAARNGFPETMLRSALEQHPGFKYGSEWVPELQLLQDGDVVAVGDYRFTCLHTPGHTLGHTCLYEAREQLLVAGDHILIDITPNIQCWSATQNPLAQYIESLDRVGCLDIGLVLPGHRRLISDARSRIAELKQHHQHRCDEILNILDGAGMSAFDVAARMTWDIRCERWEEFPVPQQWFATGEAIAHLRYLEEQGRVRHHMQNGASSFSLA